MNVVYSLLLLLIVLTILRLIVSLLYLAHPHKFPRVLTRTAIDEVLWVFTRAFFLGWLWSAFESVRSITS